MSKKITRTVSMYNTIPRYPSLKIFSKGLQSIVRLTANDRLEIFKESDLEKFQIFHIVDTIWEYRAINRYTTETYESLYKSYVKTPYHLNNKKDVEKQIINIAIAIDDAELFEYQSDNGTYIIDNGTIAIDDAELFEYQSDNGTCYAQTLLIMEVILPNKSPFHLALVQ
ncbi:hypothetical protein Glove_134g19 [Diversispora epigaea]|uniref:Uncharacterized protein n=1 Tax=Diversispora epigaea TaxID=1348612 RepID=A0A397IZS8_9GLOM|nr:hypothetical protein Glove_134g19 [Diversispora epigaea]